MKFAEYVEFATQTRYQESVFLGPYPTFLILTLSGISEIISRTDRGRTNDLLYLLITECFHQVPRIVGGAVC